MSEQHSNTQEHQSEHSNLLEMTAHAAISTRLGRGITASALVAAGVIGYWSSSPDTVPEQNSCMAGSGKYGHDYVMIGDTSEIPLTRITKNGLRTVYHDASAVLSTLDFGATGTIANDNRNWGNLAALETKRRGYTITAAQLANLNPRLSTALGGLIGGIDYRGPACITLPAPGVYGAYITNGSKTVKEYTQDAIDSVDQIVKLNPGLAVRDTNGKLDAEKTLSQVLPAGFVIKTKNKVDFSLFEQKMTKQFYDIYQSNTALGRKIRSETDATGGLKPGDQAEEPPVQTTWMKDHGITVANEQHEFAHSYDTPQLGEQQLAKPATSRPVLPPAQPTQPAQPTNMELMRLENYRFEGYHGETYGNPKYAKYDIKYGHKYGIDPALLMALSIEESADWTNRNTSRTGAVGRMQFEPKTWDDMMDELGLPRSTSRRDPRISTLAAAVDLRDLGVRMRPYVNKHHSLTHLKLDSYNIGVGGVQEALAKGINPDTLTGDGGHYAEHIIAMAGAIKAQFGKLHLTNEKRKTTTNQIIPDHIGNFVYYSQTDGTWNRYPVYTKNGEHNTLGWVGCWESSMAMAISTLTGQHVTPKDMANFATRKGYIINDGGVETNGLPATQAAAKAFGLESQVLDLSDKASINKWLQGGGFIMLAGTYDPQQPHEPFTSEGHDILLRKVRNGKYYIGDPAVYVNSVKPWTASQLFIPEHKLASGKIVGTHYAVGIKLPNHQKPPKLAIAK